MNKNETLAAMQVWSMAITHALINNTDIDHVDKLAQLYGLAISTPENIEAASHLFNWTQLERIITEANK